MKYFYTLLLSLIAAVSSAQVQLVRIQDIQGWQGQFLPDSCNDGPNPIWTGSEIRINAVVVTNGGLNETTGQTRWIWVRDVTATDPCEPFCGITVRASSATSPTDINTLVAGDTIEVIGTVSEFNGTNGGNGETQFNPSLGGVTLVSFSPGPAPEACPTLIGKLNGSLNLNGMPSNRILTGEPFEGNFVQINNSTVVQVALSGDRCRLLVKDSADNHVWIYDRFRTQRLSNGFVAPNVGDQYTMIKGMVEGWKTDCPGAATGNRGYNINPFSLTHYIKGASSPAIGNIRKVLGPCPNSTTQVKIAADISDDGSIISAELMYSLDGTVYNAVPMTPAGTRYTGQIPAQPTGSIVRYYIRAKDDVNNTTVMPNVPGQITPFFYFVNNDGCTIKDMQYTPYSIGRSGYVGDTVTLQGIVTASAASDNLGYVYIQQPGISEWGGIWINGGSLITNLAVGDKVSVTGTVEEYFGLTRLSNISAANVVQTGQPVPTPIAINSADMSLYDFAKCEKYESMLVSLSVPANGLFVVDTNADASSSRNNGEYRIGSDINDPTSGCRVLAGRQGSSTFSSLNVSYVNSPLWQTVDGTMNVEPFIVWMGQPVLSAQGILTYSFSNMKLLPRNTADLSLNTSTARKINRQIKIRPNPAQDQITIEEVGPLDRAEVFNSNGRLMSVQSADNLKVGSLSNGLYRVQLVKPDGTRSSYFNVSVVK
jgi:hypothetical protein